ncbi:MAG TPA: type II secretion system F family protein [Terracidiphilus sp.]|jgi:tight adherence protein B|nr:type II secretion system F family protein [Terracidiphilus sp.]
MPPIVLILIFVGVFTVVSVPVLVIGSSRRTKQVMASLDSALATEAPSAREQIINLRKDSSLSSIPWLNRRLLRIQLAPYLHGLLKQANVKWSAGKLMLVSAACFAVPAFGVYNEWGNPLIALAAGLVLGAAPFMWILFMRSRRFDKFQEGLPEALDLMVSALKAGHSLIAAMGLVARECPDPIGSEFRACFDEQNYGLELKSALDNMQHRVPVQDLKITCTAIMIQKESGGNLAEVLDKTAHVIRERFRLKRQVQTHTAQGRLTGWILSLLPVGLGTALYFVNPTMMSVLWHKDIGIKLIWTAVGMTLLGGIVIRNIVNLDI